MNLSLLFALKVIVFGCALQQTIVAACAIAKSFAMILMKADTREAPVGNFFTSIILWTIFYALTCFTPDYINALK